jgi:hypothetical protein
VTAIDVWDQGPLSGLASGLGLAVRYVRMDVYDLTPALGEFDLVVCGSVLLHLWNPFAALRAMASVCRDRAIVATAILRTRFWHRRRPLAELAAARGQGGDTEYWTTWYLSAAAVRELMLAAGFARVEQRADFELESAPGRQGFRVRHGVFHGFV